MAEHTTAYFCSSCRGYGNLVCIDCCSRGSVDMSKLSSSCNKVDAALFAKSYRVRFHAVFLQKRLMNWNVHLFELRR